MTGLQGIAFHSGCGIKTCPGTLSWCSVFEPPVHPGMHGATEPCRAAQELPCEHQVPPQDWQHPALHPLKVQDVPLREPAGTPWTPQDGAGAFQMLQAMATFKSTLQHVPPGQEAGISIKFDTYTG